MKNTANIKYILNKGQCAYRVLLPESANFYEKFAADELVHFFGKATGFKLTVEHEKTGGSAAEPCISLGDTLFKKRRKISGGYSLLKRDGYKIVTVGDSLVLFGGGGYGTLYAVYGLLKELFGYEFYASDEIKLARTSNVRLPSLDITDIPSFENRCIAAHSGKHDLVTAARLKGFSDYGFYLKGGCFWGYYKKNRSTWAHNHIRGYMPTDLYFDEHRAFYSPEYSQLCLTNGQMRLEFIERLKQLICDCPEAEYFMLGQEDRNTFCGCPSCRRRVKKLGESGVMMEFVNFVAANIESWRKKTCPNRVIYIATFAYQRTQMPPVRLNDAGVYEPLAKSVVPRDNVIIVLAPIFSDFSHPVLDEKYNANSRKLILGWAAITKNIAMWTYYSNFTKRFFFFDNLRAIEQDYKDFKDLGVKWLFNSCQAAIQGTAFDTMFTYVHSRLSWDVSLNLNDLIAEFMDAYYKAAAPQMAEYLQYLDGYVNSKKLQIEADTGKWYRTRLFTYEESQTVMKADFWSKEAAYNMLSLLKKAEDAAKAAAMPKKTVQAVLKRIMYESFTAKFLLFEFFGKEIADEKGEGEYNRQLAEFSAQLKELNIEYIKLREPIETTVSEWREKAGVKSDD